MCARPLIAGCFAALLSGCGARHSADEKYYLVATNIKLPYWQAAQAGLFRAAAQLKVKAEMVGPDSYDPKVQQQEFNRVAKLNPSGILISPGDPVLLREDIDRAMASGIPVVTIDSDSPASKRLCFIGTNNYQAGVLGGQVAVKHLGGKGNVVVFSIPGQANLDERLRGYRDVFADHPQIRVIDVINVKGDPRIAFDRTQEVIEKGKLAVDAFVCLEASGGKGVAEVVDRKQLKGKPIVAMDTDEETLEWIQKGLIVATIAQKPFTMALVGLKTLDDIHHHRPKALDVNWSQEPFALVPTFVDTGSTLIDKTNLNIFLKARDFATSEE